MRRRRYAAAAAAAAAAAVQWQVRGHDVKKTLHVHSVVQYCIQQRMHKLRILQTATLLTTCLLCRADSYLGGQGT